MFILLRRLDRHKIFKKLYNKNSFFTLKSATLNLCRCKNGFSNQELVSLKRNLIYARSRNDAKTL